MQHVTDQHCRNLFATASLGNVANRMVTSQDSTIRGLENCIVVKRPSS